MGAGTGTGPCSAIQQLTTVPLMNAKSILLIMLLLALFAISVTFAPNVQKAQDDYRARTQVDFQLFKSEKF